MAPRPKGIGVVGVVFGADRAGGEQRHFRAEGPRETFPSSAKDGGRAWGAFGGARRDEEKSRAKERIFSFRSAGHVWDPRRQRPELWNLFNTRIRQGESIRVFPLSNWTEFDIWQYIMLQKIPVVPLYFAEERPVVRRDGMLIMVDDERFPLKPGRETSAPTSSFSNAWMLSAHRCD